MNILGLVGLLVFLIAVLYIFFMKTPLPPLKRRQQKVVSFNPTVYEHQGTT